MSGKPMLEVKSKQDTMKNLAKAYSVTWDYNLALDMVLGSYTPTEFKKWKRRMKTEVFNKMIKEELADLLTDHGLDKTYTLDLFAKVIEMAQDKKDVTNLMRAVENLQGMHGMKDKQLVKTTESIEAISNTKLIDELREEEDKLIATKTTTEEK
jgi:pseudouridine-5'-phosphate glycosidase